MFDPDPRRGTNDNDQHRPPASDFSVPFVGRQVEREKIKTSIKTGQHRLVHISGFPMLGKAALAQQVVAELAEEFCDSDQFNARHLPCRNLNNWHDFLTELCNIYQVQEKEPLTEQNIHAYLRGILEEEPQTRHVILLTKCDDLLSQEGTIDTFLTFLENCVVNVPNLYLIVTSQKVLHFSANVNVLKEPLSVMTLNDSVNLLQKVAPDVNLFVCGREIAEGCQCLPLLILHAGQLLTAHHGCLEPTELCEILKNQDDAFELFNSIISRSDIRVKDLITKVLRRLPPDLRQHLSILSVFENTFTADAAKEVMNKSNNTATKLKLLPLLGESVVHFDPNIKRYSLMPFIQPIIRSDPGFVSSNSMVELRYIKFFGNLLLQIGGDMYLQSMDRIFGYLHDDYKNIEVLLRKAIHNPIESGSLFKAYMEVVKGLEDMIVICFPCEAENFYMGVKNMAAMFGTAEDMAILKSHQALAMTGMLVGGRIPEAVQLYEEAMHVLKKNGADRYQCLLLIQRMIRTYNRMGRNLEVKRYIQLAHSLSFQNSVLIKADRLKLWIAADEIRLEIFHENYESVAAVIGSKIEEAQRLAPHHPAIGKFINCIGLLNDRSNRNKKEALKHYVLSIQEKKKYELQCPEMMVDSMNNAAMLICKEQKNSEIALEMLEKALKICVACRNRRDNYDTALTLWNMGQIYMRKLDFARACDKILEAKNIFTKSTPEHWANVEVRWTLAHCYMATMRFQDAIHIFEDIQTYQTLYAKHMPQGELVSSAIEHLLYLDSGNSWLTIHAELIRELKRIQEENVRAGNEEKRVENNKKEQRYDDLARQFQSEHEKSKFMRPANPILMTCFICERYRIPFYSPVVPCSSHSCTVASSPVTDNQRVLVKPGDFSESVS
ncbi:hypothetical protein ScPMuIL_016794 [Solemya velum]